MLNINKTNIFWHLSNGEFLGTERHFGQLNVSHHQSNIINLMKIRVHHLFIYFLIRLFSEEKNYSNQSVHIRLTALEKAYKINTRYCLFVMS